MTVDKRTEATEVQRLWSMLDQMRGQVATPHRADLLAPLSALLFLRWAGKFEAEQEAIAAFDGTDHEPMLPACLRWEALQMAAPQDFGLAFRQSGLRSERQNVVAAHLETALEELASEKAQPLLPPLFHFVHSLPFETPSEMVAAESILAEIIPSVSQKAGWYAFEYYTPEPICELMVGLADPQPGDRIYDPCFGVGGLLVESARRLREKSRQLPPRTWIDLGQNTFYGVELNRRAHLIGLTRLLLLGFHRPGLQVGDSLVREPYGSREKFSCVLAVPPWGGRRMKDYTPDHFPIRSRDTLSLFMQHVAMSLRPNGRAVVAVPNGFLFKTGADRQIRKMLMQDFCLEGVIGLPEKSFAPYTMIGGNLVLLRKREPAQNVRFLRVPELAGVGGTRSEIDKSGSPAAQPAAIVEKFRTGKLNAVLWETPVQELAQRDWDLQVRRSGHDELEQFLRAVQDVDEEIPQQELGTIADVRAGIPYDRRSTTESRVDGVYPLIRVADIFEKNVRDPNLYLLPERALKIDAGGSDIRTQLGDVLVTTSGTIGKIAVVAERSANAVPAKSVVTVRPRPGVLGHYLEGLLRSGCYQSWLRGHARGATIQHLSLRAFKSLPVPLPPLQVQAALVTSWQREGGDAATLLIGLLRGEEHDVVTTWLHSSTAVTALVHAAPDRDSGRSALLQNLAQELRGKEMHIDFNNDVLPPEELLRWFLDLGTVCTDWQDSENRPDGIEKYALLESAAHRLSNMNGWLASLSGETADRAGLLVDRVKEIVEDNLHELVDEPCIAADPSQPTVAKGTEVRLPLRITNQSPLLVRRLKVTVVPADEGWPMDSRRVYAEEQIPALAPGASAEVSMPLPTDAGVGLFPFRVEWLCYVMNGNIAGGAVPCAIRVTAADQRQNPIELGRSPYNGQNPVQRREMFFGRAATRDKVNAQLQKSDPASVILLLGNRRMGKTSILNRLRSGEWLDRHLCVYCSFQGVSNLQTGALFRHMANMVGQQAYDAGVETWHPNATPRENAKPFKKEFKDSLGSLFSEDEPLATLEVYLEHVLDALGDKRLLLMIDEFDKAQEGIDAGITNPMFPDNLRFLVHTYRGLSLMLVGSPQVRSVRNRYWSALFGLGETIPVGPLERAESRLLVTRPVPHLTYVPEAADRVVELCACRANLVQKLCDQVFSLAKEQKTEVVTLDMVERSAREITVDNEHCSTLWDEDCLNERQRFILCLCARMSKGGDRITYGAIEAYLEDSSVGIGGTGLEEDIEHLCDAEILRLDASSAEGAYIISVPLMRNWLNDRDFEVQQRKAVRESMKGYV